MFKFLNLKKNILIVNNLLHVIFLGLKKVECKNNHHILL